MGSERCSLLHRHPAAGVGGLEMAVGFQNSKFLSVHFFSIYHTGVYPKCQGHLTARCEVVTFWYSGITQQKSSLPRSSPPSVLRVIQNPFGKVIFVKQAP